MKKHLIIALFFLTSISILSSCGNKPKKLPSGVVTIQTLKQGEGKETPKEDEMLTLQVIQKNNKDTVLFNTYAAGQPLSVPYKKAQYKGDINEAIALLHKGDSVLITILTDSFLQMHLRSEKKYPEELPQGSWIKFYIKVLDIQTREQFEKKMKEEEAVQIQKQDAEIQKYIADNKLANMVKTQSGLYYTIVKPGAGANIKVNSKAVMSYTGALLNGQVFDSNQDSSFHHTEPFEFVLGKGMVMAGWEEGVSYLNKGAKAKFIIPSSLAYGKRGSPPVIPPNAILVFDVTLNDIK